MKKYLVGLFALILAVGMSAFTTISIAKKTSLPELYWYSPGGSPLGHGEFPNNGCTITGTGCANGFENPPIDPVNDTPVRSVMN